jgi:hypothetical protein
MTDVNTACQESKPVTGRKMHIQSKYTHFTLNFFSIWLVFSHMHSDIFTDEGPVKTIFTTTFNSQ